MDILEALKKLDGLFDCLGECGVLSDEEFDEMNLIEDTILDFDIDEIEPQEINHGALTEKWLVPPFSVLHANKGAWLDRKRKWVEFGIRSEIGRGGDLCYSFPSGWVGKGQGGNKDE